MTEITVVEEVVQVTVSEENVVTLTVGVQGPIGAQGPIGLTGATGAQGDPGPGLAAGGTIGQVATKASATDYDVTWADAQGAVWGGITGTLSNQTDLQSALDGKALTIHSHFKADITDFSDGDYATSVQGGKADTAVQPLDNVSVLTDDGTYEPAFLKNTAFNKDFGTGSPQVARGNHLHIGVYEPADATILKDADIGVNVQAYDATILVDADIGVNVAAFNHNHAGVYEPADATILKDADIGVNIEAYVVKNTGWNLALGTSAGTVAEGNHNHTGVYEPADATILKDADIGVTVAAFNHNHTGVYEPANANIQSHIGDSTIHFTVASLNLGSKADLVGSPAVVPDVQIGSSSVTQHQAALSITESQISDFGTYEPAFSKNTGFNLNLGTSTGTVSEGNHLHTGVYEPANANIQSHIGDSSIHFTVASIDHGSVAGLGDDDHTQYGLAGIGAAGTRTIDSVSWVGSTIYNTLGDVQIAANSANHNAIFVASGVGNSKATMSASLGVSYIQLESQTTGADLRIHQDDGTPNILEIDDLTTSNARLFVQGNEVLTTASSIDHGGLAGLGDDDHPQYLLKAVSINNQTGTAYPLVLTDAYKYVRINNASANTVTVPLNSSVAYEVGTQIDIRQVGAGQTTIVATGGVTINTAETLLLRKQGSTATLIKVGTDEWDLTGDLEAA